MQSTNNRHSASFWAPDITALLSLEFNISGIRHIEYSEICYQRQYITTHGRTVTTPHGNAVWKPS